ncbi:MAG: DUF1842 domain-containing protein [Candidatus Thiodiazotropha sp. (ex Dulcina madagascariensis)]|nr:DUF1842 domain-containing protein [Candidatus Thiodiazotropha sp. (ex Dulcina madagascariensis)]MCU7928384.1 DUF1842 domain-containing protein [Candidatus Thiodiazotropha sp. (ex Dulcina madagascariensis)]
MYKFFYGIFTALTMLATSSAAMADSHELKDVGVFRACFETEPSKIVGAPTLNLKLLVSSMPTKNAFGSGKVSWGSVKDFKGINTTVEGPWYYMCTMDSCAIRFDFKGQGLQGMLVTDGWGSPGTFIYHFKGGPGEVKQKAAVCN